MGGLAGGGAGGVEVGEVPGRGLGGVEPARKGGVGWWGGVVFWVVEAEGYGGVGYLGGVVEEVEGGGGVAEGRGGVMGGLKKRTVDSWSSGGREG